jgi:enamine deaminase RidA (YjgF/YER057c/UK114 family)
MTDVSRRKAFAAVPLAGAALAPVAARAAQTKPAKIERYALTPRNMPGIPRISYVIARGDTVYTAGVTASLAGAADDASPGDIKAQTHAVLKHIDELLAQAGTNKSKLLTANVWLTDMSLFAEHNDAWNEWVDPENPPVRACLPASRLFKPGLMVEIMVTAAR